MGIIRSGILSRVSGKVAGVVGAHWKDKSYLREYVIPTNPNTNLQQTQRRMMASVVSFAKPLVGPIFNPFTDKFQKSMSGFNRFIADNISFFNGSYDYDSVILTQGKLDGLGALGMSPGTAATVDFSFSTEVSNNGAATDLVMIAMFDSVAWKWYFLSPLVERSTGVASIPYSATGSGNPLKAYAFAAQYSITSPTLLQSISMSSVGSCLA